MNRFIVCLLLSALAAFASATPFNDCGSSGAQVTAVHVDDCPDGQDTCTLKKGSNPKMAISFKSNEVTKKLNAVVHGVIHHVPMPFPLPQPDACKSGVSCPVENGKSYTYSNIFNVKTSYPAISVTVRYELKGENGEDLVCVEIPCEIK